jgi:hypothetical protein
MPKEVLEHEGMQKSDAISNECERRAREKFPQYFVNEKDMFRTNGGTVTIKYRSKSVMSFGVKSLIIHA